MKKNHISVYIIFICVCLEFSRITFFVVETGPKNDILYSNALLCVDYVGMCCV